MRSVAAAAGVAERGRCTWPFRPRRRCSRPCWPGSRTTRRSAALAGGPGRRPWGTCCRSSPGTTPPGWAGRPACSDPATIRAAGRRLWTSSRCWPHGALAGDVGLDGGRRDHRGHGVGAGLPAVGRDRRLAGHRVRRLAIRAGRVAAGISCGNDRRSAARGRPACGAVRYRLDSAPLFVHCRHRLDRQRQTGMLFMINVLIETDRVEVLAGSPQPVDAPATTAASSGSSAARCARWRCSASTAIPASASSAPARSTTAAVAPDVHIYTRSKVPWVVLPDGVPRLRRLLQDPELWPPASLERLDAVPAQPGRPSG